MANLHSYIAVISVSLPMRSHFLFATVLLYLLFEFAFWPGTTTRHLLSARDSYS
jgi:hypothetical protein